MHIQIWDQFHRSSQNALNDSEQVEHYLNSCLLYHLLQEDIWYIDYETFGFSYTDLTLATASSLDDLRSALNERSNQGDSTFAS